MRLTQVILTAAVIALAGCSASAGLTSTPPPVIPATAQAQEAQVTIGADSSVVTQSADSTDSDSPGCSGKYCLL